jgi:hypothetical protein
LLKKRKPYLELEEEEGMTRVEKGRASTFTFKPKPGTDEVKYFTF